MIISREEFLNSKPVMDTYKEILELYVQKNEEESLGIPLNELEEVALSRARAEVYVQFCYEGKLDKPEKCALCPCCVNNRHIEDYATCTMAPQYVVHQPNLELMDKRPSWCPMNERDEIQDIIHMYLAKQNGPVQ